MSAPARLRGARLEQLVEQIPGAVYVMGGLDRAWPLIHPDDQPRVADTVHALLEEGRPATTEFRVTRPDGEPIWLRDAPAVVYDGERRLLAAGIAHEINTPTQFVGDTVRLLGDAFGDLVDLLDVYQQLLVAADRGPVPRELIDRVREAEDRADLDYLRARVPGAVARAEDGVHRVATIVRAMRDFAHPPATKEVGRGTGQGLAIARQMVVDRHGGTITFDTQPGHGTTFHVRLPVAGCATEGREVLA
jgi:signal transduction histidine kinase